MAVDLNQLQADDAAYAKQTATAFQAKQAQDAQAKQPPTLATLGTADRGRVSSSMIDGIVNEVEQWGTAVKRVGQDAAAGAATAAKNTMDFVSSQHPDDPNDPANAPTPLWDHAKSAVMNFRDAVAVKDPNIVDGVAQAGAQLIAPFTAYSKALTGLQGFAKVAAAGTITDVTALGPHDMRMADMIALGKQTDTKIGAVLRAVGPYGLNAYVNYLADRTNESEAEGRFKNALDGLGTNLVVAPLLHAAGIVVKQGQTALRSMTSQGVSTAADLAPKRPPLQQGADPAEDMYKQQARRDADAAAANPTGKRPPLRQGGADPAEAIYREQVRRDVENAHDALPAEAPPGWGTIEGGGESPEDGSSLNGHPGTKAFANTLMAQADNPSGAPLSKLSSVLQQHLPNDEEGNFFKEVLQRVSANNPETKVFTHSEAFSHPVETGGVARSSTQGLYRCSDDTLHIYPGAFRNPARLTQVFAHEAVHAATVKTLDSSPRVFQDFQQLIRQATDSAAPQGDTKILSKADQYGFKNPHEFVAEMESNPRFRKAMQNTRPFDASGYPAKSGPTIWDLYKDKIAGILGVGGVVAASPLFDKLLGKEEKNGA